MKRNVVRFCAIACLATLGFSSSASAELIYGIAAVGNSTNLVTWDSAAPTAVLSGSFVSGLQVNETIVGLDYRPATGQLYALGSSSRLYTLNPSTGAATAVAGAFAPPLNGFSFGFDFNPVIDRIRNVAETGMNRVLNPNGTVQAQQAALFYAAGDPNAGVHPNVVHSAYTNNFVGAGSTTLYGIDTALNVLVIQSQTTPGQLTTVGGLVGVDPGALGGFDISGDTGIAYAALLPESGSASRFYTINLATGAASLVGPVDGGMVITAMTVAPVIPEPATLGMAAVALVGGLSLRRRSA